jgi:nucleoside-diphosphate-sugar epimerase
MRKKILVVGALGVVGRAVLEYAEGLTDCDLVALSRRKPDFQSRAEFLSVDLRDRAQCLAAFRSQKDISHVVYAALHEQPSVVKGWTEADHVRVNLEMVANLIDGLEEAGAPLRHIALLQGGKAYGIHLGPPAQIPSRETDPRTMPPNFYYDQEDFLVARQQNRDWSWTAFRPPGVAGFAVGSPMNTLVAVGVLAALTREFGLPLRFPGALGHLKDMCDSSILAKAILWSGETAAAANQIFNIANGDCFLWEQLWPEIADVFGMEIGEPHAMSLARVMPDKGAAWDSLVRKHELKSYSLEQLVPAWDFVDFTLRHNQRPFHSLLSTIKLRQAGFHDCMDSRDMLVGGLKRLQALRVLPR